MWLFSCCNTIYILQTVLKILMNLTVLHERDRSSHRSASSTCLPRITCALCCCFYFKLAILVTLYQFQESGTLVKVTNQPHWVKIVSFDVYIQSTEYTLSVFFTWLGGCYLFSYLRNTLFTTVVLHLSITVISSESSDFTWYKLVNSIIPSHNSDVPVLKN